MTNLNRRAFLGTLTTVGLGAVAGCASSDQINKNYETGGNEKQLRQAATTYLTKATLYKAPNCTCCDGHKKYLELTTYVEITVNNVDDLMKVKSRFDVPKKLVSCHTLGTGKYTVEGMFLEKQSESLHLKNRTFSALHSQKCHRDHPEWEARKPRNSSFTQWKRMAPIESS